MAPSEAPVYAIDSYPFQKAPALLRWRSVQRREAHLTELANPDECRDAQPRLACAAKEALLLEEKLRDRSPTEQVAGVYAYFNAFKYKEHEPECSIDCWKSRLQFLAQREGDCGDHALAEYFTLKRLGFKERDLQLIVAQLPGFEDSFKGGHVVLRVRADDAYYILDNRRTNLADLSGLLTYKVLAGMNADSVQIYNLVTPTPPAGYVADETQVASLIASPGTSQQQLEDVLVAEVTPDVPVPQPQPAPETVVIAQAQSQPSVIAEQPKPIQVAAQVAAVQTEEEAETACMQTAQLSDWNPMMPCTEVVKTFKLVIKAKTIIGAEPPKPAETKPSKPVEVAEAPKAPEPPKVEAPKAPEPKPAAKPVTVTPAPAPKSEAVVDAKDEDDSNACMQGATLGDWNSDLPCTADGNSSALRIEFKD